MSDKRDITAIRDLFDPGKDIYRAIEKVITYGASQEDRLRQEISEYVVTESIEDNLYRLLEKMEAAMSAGGANAVGVWVSGFYGSGKSSFTKYLGLALDSSVKIDGQPFLHHFRNRLNRAPTKAFLTSIANRFPAAVVLLDLASEMVAGATMEDVSTVLYYKVLQWAGYSQSLKVAALEQRLEIDGRHHELEEKARQTLGLGWKEIHNDPLVMDGLLPEWAHELYPQLFRTPTAFSTDSESFVRFENARVAEMIDIVRRKSGKEYVILIIDEVGQYIASRPSLITNLDGLAKNIKAIGDGEVWIVGTAQQTLTEDDPRAAILSAELYKLKDRFPIHVDLESRDIREICYRRLLGKSAAGEELLGRLFDTHGQGLRHRTKLENAPHYDTSVSRETFTNLYPFLPAHFDLLLHLLGSLAKSTGGIGLRSAIKVLQDILVEGRDGRDPVADMPVGQLATTVTLYDVLEKDIRRAAHSSISQSVEKTLSRFPDSPLHQGVAKTVAILQIIDSLPATVENVAALMQPTLDTPLEVTEVRKAVDEMLADKYAPFAEEDGSLRFLSEYLNNIDQERAQIHPRSLDTRRQLIEALRELFSPQPSARVAGTMTVTAGVKYQDENITIPIVGERETVQLVLQVAEPADYETARSRALDESRLSPNKNIVYLLGRRADEIADKAAEAFRSLEIANRYRASTDPEVKKYCNSQQDRASRLLGELRQVLKHSFTRGSLLFRGQATAVEALRPDLLEAIKLHLAGVAGQVYHRYQEAPYRADTVLAERFLRVGSPAAITSSVDPLGLVKGVGNSFHVDTDHKALVSIRDYLRQSDRTEGRRLMEHFADAPFGWSADTLRYLVAAMLMAGELRLTVAGVQVTGIGQQALDALKTNNTFRNVGVALRAESERPPIEVCAKAVTRLLPLLGENVVPLEDEIRKAVVDHLRGRQSDLARLEGRLAALGLPGAEKATQLSQDIRQLLQADGTGAVWRFGGEDAPFADQLTWAREVETALDDNGLEATVKELRRHISEVSALPGSGVPGALKQELSELVARVADRLSLENFHTHAADLNTMAAQLRAKEAEAAKEALARLREDVARGASELGYVPEWKYLLQQDQSAYLAQLEAVVPENLEPGLDGLKTVMAAGYRLQDELRVLKQQVQAEGQKRLREQLRQERVREPEERVRRSLRVPRAITDVTELRRLISDLRELESHFTAYAGIEVTIELGE